MCVCVPGVLERACIYFLLFISFVCFRFLFGNVFFYLLSIPLALLPLFVSLFPFFFLKKIFFFLKRSFFLLSRQETNTCAIHDVHRIPFFIVYTSSCLACSFRFASSILACSIFIFSFFFKKRSLFFFCFPNRNLRWRVVRWAMKENQDVHRIPFFYCLYLLPRLLFSFRFRYLGFFHFHFFLFFLKKKFVFAFQTGICVGM